jgi:hypothetical protein
MKIAVPKANPGLYLPMALAVTFPFNITFGMPIYLSIILSSKLTINKIMTITNANRGLEQETLDKYKGGVIYEKIGDASLQQRPFICYKNK